MGSAAAVVASAEVLLCTWMILDVGVSSSDPLPEITDGKFIDECVREHNMARSSVVPPASNMLHMTWDGDLAVIARAWAKQCIFKHNSDHSVHPSFSYVGENIWTGQPPSFFSVKRAMQLWMNESLDYNYKQNKCSGAMCGHYTQVVWATSTKVGCAVQHCPNGVISFDSRNGAIFVCNYAPGGNTNGYRPYETDGAACSGCDCDKNLCHGYSGSPDGDSAPATATSHYVYILVVRPVALILTFAAAYAAHRHYPDVFCYE